MSIWASLVALAAAGAALTAAALGPGGDEPLRVRSVQLRDGAATIQLDSEGLRLADGSSGAARITPRGVELEGGEGATTSLSAVALMAAVGDRARVSATTEPLVASIGGRAGPHAASLASDGWGAGGALSARAAGLHLTRTDGGSASLGASTGPKLTLWSGLRWAATLGWSGLDLSGTRRCGPYALQLSSSEALSCGAALPLRARSALPAER